MPDYPSYEFRTEPSGIQSTKIDWFWTDWVGLAILLLALAFVATVITALLRKVPPLKILGQIAKAMAIWKKPS